MSDFPLTIVEINQLLDLVFAEDVGGGDVTSEIMIPEDATLTATMNAREPIVLAGLTVAKKAFERLDNAVVLEAFAFDGDSLAAGDKILTISGNARSLLTAERTALNIVQHLSGISTLTNCYVKEISHTNAKLLDTRKTIPGLRKLAKYAAKMGGAVNHRMGLFDAVMMKDNHIAVHGDLAVAIAQAKAAGRNDIQVECDTLTQVEIAVAAGADSLLLDNMSNDELRTAVAMNTRGIPLEASGGVTLKTIKSIAETGVDFISVGRITQSAPAVDIGLDFNA